MATKLIAVVVVGALLATLVAAVDRNNFKTCQQSGFCKRNRRLSDDDQPKHLFNLVPSTVSLSNGILGGELQHSQNNHQFTFELHLFGDKQVRIKVNEKNPLHHPRYEVQDVIVGMPAVSSTWALASTQAGMTRVQDSATGLVVQIKHAPFELTVLDGSVAVFHFNNRGLMNFEHQRNKIDDVPPPTESAAAPAAHNDEDNADHPTEFHDEDDTDDDATPAAATPPVNDDGLWEETFRSATDKKPYGPESLGVDLTFGSNIVNIYGLPEHSSPLNLPDTKGPNAKYTDPYRLYNLDVFEYEIDNPMSLYGSIPFLLGHRAGLSVGVYWNNAAETWVDVQRLTEISPKRTQTHWFSESGILDVFVFVGSTPAQILQKYTSLTGTSSLPRLFALGYHQCRWNYNDEQDVAGVDEGFEKYDIPYDVIWLDIEHTDAKKYFTWDPVKFANPLDMQANLAKRQRKLVTIVDPHIKRVGGYHIHDQALSKDLYVKDDNNQPFEGWCWPGSSSWVDFLNPTARQWWAEKFALDQYTGSTQNLHVWNDMNEPSVFNGPEITMHKHNRHHGGWEHRDIHNIYGFYQFWATWDALKQRDGKRPFVLSRAFFAGSQRHGAIWTGDNAAKFEHLQASIPMLLSLNVAGFSFAGADVGGFFGNPSEELFTRWYEVGSFQPFFRGHAHLDTRRREPWIFGEPYTSLVREAIRRRYSLLPLWYSLFREASQTGAPVLRPLFYEFPEDASTFGIDSSFMVGSSILVQPVTAQGATTQEVFLPGEKQIWYNYATFAPIKGGQRFTVDAPLGHTPVFIRGGTVIPRKDRVRRSTALMQKDPYTLIVALNAAKTATGRLYIDDGESFSYQSGAYADKVITYANNALESKDFAAVPSAHVSAHDLFARSTMNGIERIAIVGLERPPTSIQNGNHKLSFFVDGQTVIIKRPNILAAADWRIDLTF